MNERYLSVCMMAFLLLFCSSVLAQVGPTGGSSVMLSGAASFSSSGGDLYSGFSEDTSNRLTLISGSGSMGLFLLSGLALGGQASLMRDSYQDYSETTWGIGPQAWVFIGGSRTEDAAGALYPFLTAAFLYSRSTVKMDMEWLDGDISESTDTLTTIKLGGGFCFMITNTVGLKLEFNYEMDDMKFGGSGDSGDAVRGNKVNVLAGISAFIH